MNGVSSRWDLCGGREEGMKYTASRWKRRCTACATAMCPAWGGSNVPPKSATERRWAAPDGLCAPCDINDPPDLAPGNDFPRSENRAAVQSREAALRLLLLPLPPPSAGDLASSTSR